MENGFAPVLIEINELLENGAIEINGTSVKLNIYIGGDIRWDVSVPKETYLKDKRRTLPQIIECSKQKMSSLKLGVLNQPLIKIDLEQIIPDELHLMLQITDVLLRNLIYAAASKDSSVIQSNETTLNLLIQIIRDCGVTFHRKKKDNLEWTSLRGTDKKKLLQKLPPKIPEVICEEGLVIMKLWEDFNFIYSSINESGGKESDIEISENKVKQWIQNFLSIKLDGHERANITPYMHLMVLRKRMMLPEGIIFQVII
uniref:Uncharacterized protein n=1 Tax=Amphimedon queenslandica TaxID=400682 RepID=A0A1X7UWC9_AMPQE